MSEPFPMVVLMTTNEIQTLRYRELGRNPNTGWATDWLAPWIHYRKKHGDYVCRMRLHLYGSYGKTPQEAFNAWLHEQNVVGMYPYPGVGPMSEDDIKKDPNFGLGPEEHR